MKRIFIFCLVMLYQLSDLEAQNRDVILNRLRVEFFGIDLYNDTLLLNGMTENYGSIQAFQPFLLHLNKDLSIQKSFHVRNDSIHDFFALGRCIRENNDEVMCLGHSNGYEKSFLNLINTKTEKLIKKTTFSMYSQFKFYSFAQGLIGLKDSGYVIYGGFTDRDGSVTGNINDNLFLQRLNKKGEEIWVKIEGSKLINEIIEDGFFRDNKIVVGISIDSTWWPFEKRERYFYLREYDLSGKLVKTSPYLNHNKFYTQRILPSTKNSWILGGTILDTTIDYFPFYNPSIIKADSNLKIQWEIKFNDDRDLFSKVNKIIKLKDGNYLGAALASYDTIWRQATDIVKFTENGQVLWRKRFRFSPLSTQNTDEIKDLIELPNGDIIGVGKTILISQGAADTFRVQRGWILKINKDGDIIASISSDNKLPSYSIYPNPFTDKITIDHLEPQTKKLDIDLINTNGSVVMHKTIKVEGEKLDIDIHQSISQGIYYLRITHPDSQQQTTYRLEKQ